MQLDKAAPVLAGLKQPIIVAKIDADKYKRLASKHEIEYAATTFWFNYSWGTAKFPITLIGTNFFFFTFLFLDFSKSILEIRQLLTK